MPHTREYQHRKELNDSASRRARCQAGDSQGWQCHFSRAPGESHIPPQMSQVWEQQGGTGISLPGTKCTSGNFEKEQKVKKKKKTVPADTTPTELPVSALHPQPPPWAASNSLLSLSQPVLSFTLTFFQQLELFKFLFFSAVLLSELNVIFRILPDRTAGGLLCTKTGHFREQKVSFYTWSWTLWLVSTYWLEKQNPRKHWQKQSSLYPWSVCERLLLKMSVGHMSLFLSFYI